MYGLKLIASVSTATPPPVKKRLGVPGIAGIIIGVSMLGILVVANLDVAGKACSDEGSLLAAVNCYEMMTSIEGLLGVRSVRLANALTDLSLCYSREGRFGDAMRTQVKAIAMHKELEGVDHPMILVLQANLGIYKTKAKDYAGAEKVLKETLAQAESKVPASPYAVGFTLNALTDLYTAQKRFAEAETVANRLAKVDEMLVSVGYYPFYGKETLSEIYARTNRLPEAERAAKEALARPITSDRNVMVPSHEALGKVYILQGRLPEAREQFDRAMALLREKFGNCEKTQYWRARYDSILDTKEPFKD